MLTGVGNRDHIISVLVHLYWLPVCFQAKFKVLMLIFTALCGSWLTYLKENLFLYEPTQLLLSLSEALLQVPPPSEIRWVATTGVAFSVVAPKCWSFISRDTYLSLPVVIFYQWVRTFLVFHQWSFVSNQCSNCFHLVVCVFQFWLCFNYFCWFNCF